MYKILVFILLPLTIKSMEPLLKKAEVEDLPVVDYDGQVALSADTLQSCYSLPELQVKQQCSFRYDADKTKQKALSQVTKLTLDLSSTNLSEVPKTLPQLTSLTILVLNNNNLGRFPEELMKLPHLHWIELSFNDMYVLPHNLHEMTQLRSLILRGNYIETLPEQFPQEELDYLCLANNKFTDIPASLRGKAVIALDLSRNDLSKADLTILFSIEHLLALNLSHAQLSQLPKGFEALQGLTHLYVNNNNLTVLPEEFNIASIQKLDIAGNPLKEIPAATSKDLTCFFAQNTNLTRLPKGAFQSNNGIGILDLSLTKIALLPTTLQGQTVTELNLSFTDLESFQGTLPDGMAQPMTIICTLNNLQELHLEGCNISELPEEIGTLTDLTLLNLRGNNLEQLPQTVTKLTKLKKLDLLQNYWGTPTPKSAAYIVYKIIAGRELARKIAQLHTLLQTTNHSFEDTLEEICYEAKQYSTIEKARELVTACKPDQRYPYYNNLQEKGSSIQWRLKQRQAELLYCMNRDENLPENEEPNENEYFEEYEPEIIEELAHYDDMEVLERYQEANYRREDTQACYQELEPLIPLYTALCQVRNHLGYLSTIEQWIRDGVIYFGNLDEPDEEERELPNEVILNILKALTVIPKEEPVRLIPYFARTVIFEN